MTKLVKNVPQANLIPEFCQILNGILQLTPRELELLAILIELDAEYVPRKGVNKNILDTQNRKEIVRRLGLKQENLSRYAKVLKEKGILMTGPAPDELRINSNLIPKVIKDRLQLTIILKLDENIGN